MGWQADETFQWLLAPFLPVRRTFYTMLIHEVNGCSIGKELTAFGADFLSPAQSCRSSGMISFVCHVVPIVSL